ncbi:hypothetical protein G4G28_11265 [Massilia sp. Dwa41.01b]|nr:hypothetical protein [Massilia sp. Dwa41.01b]QNA88923.1 hypothetical protein G4G28_11265 [Massilia sp. Dwa41.01b]
MLVAFLWRGARRRHIMETSHHFARLTMKRTLSNLLVGATAARAWLPAPA